MAIWTFRELLIASRFGAAGNVNTSTPTAFTDTIDAPFVAGDANTSFLAIVGAGAGAANLKSAITAFTSATAVTLGTGAGTTVTNANYAYSTGGQCDTNGTTTLVLTFAVALAVGDLICVIPNTDQGTISSVSDSAGNSYSSIGSIGKGEFTQAMFWAPVTVAAAIGTTVTCTFSSGTIGNGKELYVYHFSPPVGTTPVLSQSAFANGSGTALSSGNITTKYANELLISGECQAQTITASTAGWTASAADKYAFISEYTEKAAAGTVAAATYTQNISSVWNVVLASFGAVSNRQTDPREYVAPNRSRGPKTAFVVTPYSSALTPSGAISGNSDAVGGQSGALTGINTNRAFDPSNVFAPNRIAAAVTFVPNPYDTSGNVVRGASGNADAVGGQTGNLTGTGALAGTSAAVGGQTGAITGAGALVGNSDAVAGQTGTITSSNSNLGFNPSYIEAPNRQGVKLVFSPAPYSFSLPPSGAIAGTAAAVGGQTGALTGAGALAGTASAVGGQSGALTGAGVLAGNIDAVAEQSGNLAGTGALAGTSAEVASQTGTLTNTQMGFNPTFIDAPNREGARVVFFPPPLSFVNAGPPGPISGTAAAVGGQAGALTGAGALAGTSSATGGQTGALTAVGALAGTAAATSGQSGALAGAGALAGTSAATGGQTGALAGVALISGTSAATSGQSGLLAGVGALLGSAAAVANTNGVMTGAGALAGTSAAVGTASLSSKKTWDLNSSAAIVIRAFSSKPHEQNVLGEIGRNTVKWDDFAA